MKKNEIAILRVVIATGIASVVFQLVAIREFLAQFRGNEFVIALILFSWLILGGMGTLAARLLTRRYLSATANRLGWLSLILAGLAPIEIHVFRQLRDIVFVHGSSVGFYPTLIYIFLTVAPYALLIGFVLPYSLFALRTRIPDYPGARIYISDNIGDVSGGILFSFVLVYLVSPLRAILISNLLLLTAALFLFPPKYRWRPGVMISTLTTLTILVAGVVLEPASLAPAEGRLVHYRESRYGRITVHQNMEQFTLFRDGVPATSTQNFARAEESIHYPLSQLDRLNHVLMISGESGMLQELQKYRPQSVDFVELDPEISTVQFRFGLIQKIPRLTVIHQDARAYLSGSRKIYDAIIVNLPEPDTFQINRFYTDEFFNLVKRRLTSSGVLSFSMQGFDNYLAEPQRQKLSTVYNTVLNHFQHILLLPGQQVLFVCRNLPIEKDIPERLSQKGIATRYISRYFYGNLTRQRIDRLNALMDPSAPRNSDIYPRLMRIMFSQWFSKFSTSPLSFIIVLSILTGIYLIRVTRAEFVLFSTGFMTMGSEILVIFAFQIFFGYIYFQIGVIITVFLAGLLPGAWIGDRWRQKGKKLLGLTDAILIVLLIILILALTRIGYRLPIVFYLLFGFCVSLACGFQFPVALHLSGGDNPAVARSFSADLIGAACGTLITSVVLIPYWGIVWTTVALMALKGMSLFVVMKPSSSKIRVKFDETD